MGVLQELSDMARDYGLGMKYFLMVGGVLGALMLTLFLWGRGGPAALPVLVPAEAPAAGGAPTSY